MVGTIETAQLADLPARVIAETIADLFVREIFGTRRKDVIRLIITEGARFPKIAEFYYHEVIERVTAALRAIMSRAAARGELSSDALARFPQLLVAPALVALVWNSMFDRFAPLDIRELMRAHLDILFGERSIVMIRLALRASLVCLIVLAGCSKNGEQRYQGWIEANLIFVSPDEIGPDREAAGARRRPGRAERRCCSRSTTICSAPRSPSARRRSRMRRPPTIARWR